MRRLILFCLILAGCMAAQAKTLVVYYSYTNNVNRIVTELTKQIEADVIRVEMADKKIGLIVSSASSGISGVEADAKRLIPDGDFMSPSLWIRSSQTSNAATLVSDWLKTIGYDDFARIEDIMTDDANHLDIYTLTGQPAASDISSITKGIYIVRYVSNGKVTSKKVVI